MTIHRVLEPLLGGEVPDEGGTRGEKELVAQLRVVDRGLQVGAGRDAHLARHGRIGGVDGGLGQRRRVRAIRQVVPDAGGGGGWSRWRAVAVSSTGARCCA